MDEKEKLRSSIILPGSFILLLWVIRTGETVFSINLTHFGLLPNKLHGLIGIITAPLLHSGYNHLASNTLPLLFLGVGILYFFPNSAYKVFACIYIIPGIFVWFFGRPAYHIGASGMIYGFVSFLFFSGLIRRDTRSIALALLVTFLYGSMIWGIFPQNNGISWEYHLFGSLTGIACAIIFRKSDPYKRYEWEDEEDDEDGGNLEISHDRGE
ncbi:MAG: rhomboid family intramembrane serine protease [Ignavibacteriaceae bacterium]